MKIGRVFIQTTRRASSDVQLGTRKPGRSRVVLTAVCAAGTQRWRAPDCSEAHGREIIARLPRCEAWPVDAIRLDAYDADAGAGGFYAKCGTARSGAPYLTRRLFTTSRC